MIIQYNFPNEYVSSVFVRTEETFVHLYTTPPPGFVITDAVVDIYEGKLRGSLGCIPEVSALKMKHNV